MTSHAAVPPPRPHAPAAAQEAIGRLQRVLDTRPLDLALHAQMLEAMRAADDEDGCAAHEIALATFAVLGDTGPERLALALYNLATVYAMKVRHDEAARWYRHTLAVHPGLAIAHQNLAVTLDTLGSKAEAAWHRECAYRLQRVFVEPALDVEQRRLLIVSVGNGSGNVPIEGMLSVLTTSRIKYAIDYADESEDAGLPPYDLVFNAIGDPDFAAPLAARIARFARRCGRPVLNPPEAIERTFRHRTPALLASVGDAIVPACVRIDACPPSADALARRLAEAGIALPVLLRPLGKHGGEGLTLHTSLDALWSALATHGGPCYLSAYHDCRSADGYFRKYRMIYVDREPFVYHLAISPNWMVHYVTAQMLEAPWKLDEEQRFLADPHATLGAAAMHAIVEIGRRLDLDYGGIDFTLLPDGRILVFEANATMLAHRESTDGPLAHKNPYVERIADAIERMQARAEQMSRPLPSGG